MLLVHFGDEPVDRDGIEFRRQAIGGLQTEASAHRPENSPHQTLKPHVLFCLNAARDVPEGTISGNDRPLENDFK